MTHENQRQVRVRPTPIHEKEQELFRMDEPMVSEECCVVAVQTTSNTFIYGPFRSPAVAHAALQEKGWQPEWEGCPRLRKANNSGYAFVWPIGVPNELP